MRLTRIALLLLVCASHLSRAQAPVRYTIYLADPERHLVHIALEIPSGHDSHELQLPVWNALYQVRDFSQNMNWLRANTNGEVTGSHPLTLIQVNPSRWKIAGAENGARIEYEMFSDSPGSFGAQLNSHHAFFNLAQVLMYADDERNQPIQIEFRNLPAGWKIATPLAHDGSIYSAETYDRLVDSPVEIGGFEENDFNAACGMYRVIVDSESDSRAGVIQELHTGSAADDKKVLHEIIPQLQRIVSAATEWMNDCPFHSYMFIFHPSDSPGSGGMEHADGTAINLPAKDFTGDLDHFTAVTAHEFFHLWNVKRIRPQSLEPIDYTKANYTTALWFSEGVDTTASEQIRLRAGLTDERRYLEHLSREITVLQNQSARLTQSAEQSSLDAWLEKYPYYGLPQRSISYYNKGELLGVLLDLAMGDASHDQASLRNLFRAMNDQYAKQGKFFADSKAVQNSAETLSHADLGPFFAKYVSGTDEISWDDFFAPVGLQLVKTDVVLAESGFDAVQKFDQLPEVVRVRAGSEAERAGLRPNDVIEKINGKAASRDFEVHLRALGPGAPLHLVIRRDGAERDLEWKLGSRKQTIYQLQDVPNVTAAQKSRRATWLFGTPPVHP